MAKRRLHPKPDNSGRAELMPEQVVVEDDGSVIAYFGSEPSLRYESLSDLLARYGITTEDLSER